MIRLLLVDDEINVLKSLKRSLLRWLRPDDAIVELYADPLKALQRSQEEIFHIVIADYRMPEMNGIELLARIKQLQPDAIRLMLSATADFDILLEAVNTVEIFHYIRKPWAAEEIKEIVQKALARREQILAERQRKETPRDDRAALDVLTGFPDRNGFRHALLEIAANGGKRGLTALLFLGLDHFRSLNSVHGNQTGDVVLSQIAQRIRELIPPGSVVGRMGGDEFALAMPDLAEKQDVVLIARSLLEVISQPLLVGRAQIQTGASIGITFGVPDASNLERLLNEGEDAMHFAKDHGAGTWQFHSTEVSIYSKQQLGLRVQTQKRLECLTAREREVLQMLIGGKTNKMIANALGISNRTVENHRASIMEKTQATSLAELVRMAWQ